MKKYLYGGDVAPAVSTYVQKPLILPRFLVTSQPVLAEIRADNRSNWERQLGHKKALQAYKDYQKQQQNLKAQEGFNNLMRIITPSTYVEGITGQDFGPIGRLAIDFATPGVIGGAGKFMRFTGKGLVSAADRTLAATGSKAAAGRVIGRELGKAVDAGVQNQQLIFPGLIGWSPKQTFKGYHASNEAEFKPDFFYPNWAHTTHDAPYGIYMAEGTGPTGGFLAKRPYIHQVLATFDKPQILLGEVKGRTKNGTRNRIERDAQSLGADGIIFLDIADNQLQHQTIAKTLNPDVEITTGNKSEVDIKYWEKYIADQYAWVDKMHSMGVQVSPGILLKIKDLEKQIAQIKAQLATGPVVASENLPRILGPVHESMSKSAYIDLDKGPYIETKVGDENIIPIGTFKPGPYADYRAQRMIRGLLDRGVDVHENGFYVNRGNRVVGSAAKLIQDATHRPSTLYITRKETSTNGFYNVPSGKSYVKVVPDIKGKKLRSTDVHESISHGTDDLIESASKSGKQEYSDLSAAVEKAGFIRHQKKSGTWYELRATLMQLHKNIADEIKQYVKGSYQDVDSYVGLSIDKMSYLKFADALSKINGYGLDYAEYILANPTEVNKFKNLVKNGLTWGAPVGVTGYGMIPQERKGGKTHKPFGHRSILDNGWQSTKQLKNKKNVYGK